MSAPIREQDVHNKSSTEHVSALGTKEHWDSVYEREITSFQDMGEVGHIWYGENSMHRILKWVHQNVKRKNAAILDIGCGNGVLLTELAKHDYKCLTGVDYSETAIQHAQSVAKAEGLDIPYRLADILNISGSILESQKFDVCIDKGTYDAILLAQDDRNKLRKLYRENVSHVLTAEGIFIIASGNYTMSELKEFFKPEFEVRENIPAPTFSFGGQNGTTVTTVVFRKRTVIENADETSHS